MKPIRIAFSNCNNYLLSPEEIKYVFRTLLTIAGIPWNFLPENVPGSVDIYFGRKPPQNCTLFIKMSETVQKQDALPRYVSKEGNLVFLTFDKTENGKNYVAQSRDSVKHILNDIIYSTFFLLTGMQEKHIRRDKKDRHYVEDSLLYRNNLLHTPVVNQYAFLLREIFSPHHGYLPAWPGGKKWAAVLTHDVDYPEMIRWIEILRYVGTNRQKLNIIDLLNIAMGKESFWQFEEWMNLEQEHGLNSTFFFCGFKGDLLRYFLKAPDPFYDVTHKSFRRIMHLMTDKGFEVGLHGSYLAYRSPSRFMAEKHKVESTLEGPVWGNRHHYWHMNPDDPSETARIHKKIGLLYDSSLSFEKNSGFRYSICSPFHLYDANERCPVDVLQIPPTLMDNHLFGYADTCGFKHYLDHIDSLFRSIKSFEGLFVIDYHVRVLNSTFFPDWKESYYYFLETVSNCTDVYCDTLINLARYWLQREKNLVNMSLDETRLKN